MLDLIIEIISYIFISLGLFFMLTGAIGIVRMPDFFSRLHPAGMVDSIGAPLIFLGIILQEGFSFFSGKIVLLAIFMFITSPTASHAIAKSAFLCGLKPKKGRGKK